jgi:hypothetical protein
MDFLFLQKSSGYKGNGDRTIIFLVKKTLTNLSQVRQRFVTCTSKICQKPC